MLSSLININIAIATHISATNMDLQKTSYCTLKKLYLYCH